MVKNVSLQHAALKLDLTISWTQSHVIAAFCFHLLLIFFIFNSLQHISLLVTLFCCWTVYFNYLIIISA